MPRWASRISLWDSINGKKHPWSSNPYVWVIEFKKTMKHYLAYILIITLAFVLVQSSSAVGRACQTQRVPR